MDQKNIITIIGLGYVGMSLAVLLAAKTKVIVFDIDKERLEKVKNKISTVEDSDISNAFCTLDLDLHAEFNKNNAYSTSNYIIVCVPTNYDEKLDSFDTRIVESVIKDALELNKKATIIVKSTVPLGFIDRISKEHNTDKVLFSPEFLREGRALYDNLHPTRIVIGSKLEEAKYFVNLLIEASNLTDVPVIFCGSSEAEAIKLFSNAYLAMRVSFFNELDTYALSKNLNTKEIIEGVSNDPRVGNGYNNPSFGYGGYCLPKDTKQLLSNFKGIPQNLIHSIVTSNATRKDVISREIIKTKSKKIGIYKLIMKKGSDNLRSSAMQGIIQRLTDNNVTILIFEPLILEKTFMGVQVCKNWNYFVTEVDLIVTNRFSKELEPYKAKVFTRDLYGEN